MPRTSRVDSGSFKLSCSDSKLIYGRIIGDCILFWFHGIVCCKKVPVTYVLPHVTGNWATVSTSTTNKTIGNCSTHVILLLYMETLDITEFNVESLSMPYHLRPSMRYVDDPSSLVQVYRVPILCDTQLPILFLFHPSTHTALLST
jgi:hypothetical protein